MRNSGFIAVSIALIAECVLALVPAYGQLRPVPVLQSSRAEYVKAPADSDSAAAPDALEFHDPANPDSRKLQRSEDAFSGLPRDKRGAVDWMKALRDGGIAPRADLNGASKMQVLDLDIILKNTKEMPWVRFPHNSHTQWLDCSNCHDSLFVAKAGANAIDMMKIFRGEACGACHGRVAFVPTLACERCHSVPHGDVKPWW